MKRTCQSFTQKGGFLQALLFVLIFSVQTLYAGEIKELIFPASEGSFSVEEMEEEVFSNKVMLQQANKDEVDTPTIAFYKYDTTSHEFLQISQTSYSDDANINGLFSTLAPLEIDGKEIDITQKIPAVKCLIYKRDEPLIVVYHDTALKEQKSTCITIETGKDKELIKIEEISPNSATFIGYINTSTTKLQKCDGKLFVEKGTEIKASPIIYESKSRSLQTTTVPYAVAGVEIAPVETKSVVKEDAVWISSRVSKKEASSGEYLKYSIFLTNNSEQTVEDITVVNKLSQGVRYKKASFMVGEQALSDNSLSLSDTLLGYTIGALEAGEERELSFLVYVGIKAKNEVSCESFAHYDSKELTHKTKATTKIKKSLQSDNTIVGNISSDDNVSLGGIRFYLEDGSFVLSDNRGKYHFDNVSSGLHVVSIDPQSVSDGLEVFSCEQNTRYAKSKISQFVDLSYTNIKNVNFCVKKSDSKKSRKGKSFNYKIAENKTVKMPQYTSFDIEKHQGKTDFLWPKENFIPAMPSIKVAFLHDKKEKLVLYLNDKKVDMLAYDGVVKGKNKKRQISKYRGLDLEKGDNKLTAKLYGKDGSLIKEIERNVHLSTAPVRAKVIKENSYLVADGVNSAVIAVQFFDASGYVLRDGMVGSFTVESPYIAQERIDELEKNPLSITQLNDKYRVLQDGIAYIKLKATSKSGEVKLHFPFQNEGEYTKAWLKPKARDWFIVGFAEGSVGYKTLKQKMTKTQEEKLTKEGRAAFFAKGKIPGDVLLSLAYDSGKESDLALVEELDSESFYTVYGDSTVQNSEAPSSKKLYLKLEKESFYTMFGDFDTGLDTTTLAKYTRRINGLKSEYKGEVFEYNAFATKTSNLFVKDEIKGDGTSGIYKLSREDIVYASERVYIEVRDRFRDEVIISRQSLTTLLDYSVDYDKGTLYFKYPILSQDESGNPRMIVVDYEVDDGEKEAYTFGGRAAMKFMADRIEVGASYIQEDSGVEDETLYGFDARLRLSATTTFNAEYAQSHKKDDSNSTTADAMLVEVTHHDKYLDARAYFKEQADDFGLGQQNQSENATRRYGVEGTLEYWKNIAIKLSVYSDEDLLSGVKRNVGEVKALYDNRSLQGHLGYRFMQEEGQSDSQILAGVSKRFFANRLKLGISQEYSLGDATETFPNRTFFEASYIVNKYAEIYTNHELRDTSGQKKHLTHAGIKGRPWDGAVVDNTLSHEITDDALRLYNHMGFQQNLKLTKHWTLNASLDREETVEGGSTEGDFTSYALSTLYNKRNWAGNIKAEYKQAQEDRMNIELGLYNKVNDTLGLAFSLYANSTVNTLVETKGLDTKLSLVYRPENGMVLLNRFDYTDSREDSYETKKFMNNMLLHMKLSHYFELSTSYGIKYVQDTLGEQQVNSLLDTFGLEGIFNIGKQFAFGIQANVLHDYTSKEFDYATGVYIGYTLFKNGVIALGYNFDGYEADDFRRYNETNQGVYIKMKMKFDQESLQDTLRLF